MSNCIVTGYKIPEMDLESNSSEDLEKPSYETKDGQKIDLGFIIYGLRSQLFKVAILNSYAQRLEYLPLLTDARQFVLSNVALTEAAGSDELLINIRANEILTGVHADYPPVPVCYYEFLVASSGLKPVIMGQIGDNDYSREILSRFPNVRVIQHRSPLDDFRIMLSSINIALSVSTFSWIATWVSPLSQKIYLPLFGLLNPRQRPDIDLIPHNDTRYTFLDLPVFRWGGSESQLASILKSDIPIAIAASDCVTDMKRKAQSQVDL